MPDQYYLKNSRDKIQLASKAFAGGGEGDLFQIVSPNAYSKYVAKVYHPHKRSKKREEKTQYLINNPPIGLSENGSIVWIIDALYDQKYQFVGFIMPFAQGEKLEILCLGKLHKKIGREWLRFDLGRKEALNYRLRICFNLAAAIYQMHATEHYVLVDMKPENIIIQPNGLLAIVDTDSVEVIEDGVAIYPAPVATPEYTPPEFYSNQHRKNDTVGEPWDRFGLAVIFYKLLCGIHPFTGSAIAPYDNMVSLHEKIEHGLFVHSKSKKQLINVVPPPHKRFEQLAPQLQDLFIQCFEEGHDNPEVRPSANEWCSAFLKAIGDPKLEAHFAHIMGMWGDRLHAKMEMPSILYRKYELTIDPKRWIEEEISSFFEMPPPLPVTLHRAIQSGKQQLKLVLEIQDYFFSWLTFLTVIGALVLFTSGFREWFFSDVWLLGTFYINIIFIIGLTIPQVLLPRLVSLVRHLYSPEVKTRRLWRSFRLSYPQLQKDASRVKEDLLKNVLVKSKEQATNFAQQQEEHVKPLKAYLNAQDLLVKELMKERKAALNVINEAYLKKADQNPLLAEMKGQSVFALDKRLKRYHQREIDGAKHNISQKKEYQTLEVAHQTKLKALDKEETAYKAALKEETLCIFEIDHFCTTYLNGTMLENVTIRSLLEKYEIKSLYDIASMELDERDNLIITPYVDVVDTDLDETIRVTPIMYGPINALINAFNRYQKGIDYARKHTIHRAKKYYQEHYQIKQKEYETTAQKWNDHYEPLKTTFLERGVQQRLDFLKKHLVTAQLLLERLKTEEREEVLVLEEEYDVKYQQIYNRSEAKVEEITNLLDELNDAYKIEISGLMTTTEMEKIKISFDEKVTQAKKDIIILEGLDGLS